MKNNKLSPFSLSLLFILTSFSISKAQTWEFADHIRPVNNDSESEMRDFITDTNGNSYICGYFEDSINIGGRVLVSKGDEDLFIAKLDQNGTTLWAISGGGSTSYDAADQLILDDSGNLYVTGEIGSWGTIFFADTLFSKPELLDAVFFAKISPDGDLKWINRIRSIRDASQRRGSTSHPVLAKDRNNKMFLAGNYGNTVFLGNDTLASITIFNVFLLSFEADGNVNYFSHIGRHLWLQDLEVSRQDEFLLGGEMTSYPAVFGDSIFNGDPQIDDALLYKLDQQRNFLWAKRMKTQGDAFVKSIEVDSIGNIYGIAYFRGNLTIEDTTVLTTSGLRAAIFKLDADSSLLWVRDSPNHAGNGFMTYTPETQIISWFGTPFRGFSFERYSENGTLLQSFQDDDVNTNLKNISINKETNQIYLSAESNRLSIFGSDSIPASRALKKRGKWALLSGMEIKTFSQIRGDLVSDLNANCQKEPSESNIPNRIVQARILPGGGAFYTQSDAQGTYTFNLPEGNYSIQQVIPELSTYVQTYCPTTNQYNLSLGPIGIDSSGFDFFNEEAQCAFLQVAISSNRRRYCARNQTIIQYCNHGNQPESNVQIHVKYPDFVVPLEADQMWTLNPDSSYTFDIGTLAPNTCGTINITDSVRCAGVFLQGLAQCTEAWITPSNTCFLDDPNWDRASLEAEGGCNNGTEVEFIIRNTGTGDMNDSTEYRIIMDSLLVYIGKVKLTSQEEFHINFPANGATFRLEVDQVPYHPLNSWVAAVVEACTNTLSFEQGNFSNGFVEMFAPRDAELQISTECLPISGSFDPNDKQGFPMGVKVNSDAFVQAGTRISYKIRFQNTGTDTAFRIVLIDTLSSYLDISTLQVHGASHPYSAEISGQVNPVLTFTFDPIALPDSNVNEPASNGFASFSIKIKEPLPDLTMVRNFADIYFDQNPAVRTNTTLHKIMEAIPENLGAIDSLSTEYILSIPSENSSKITLYPNPNSGFFTLERQNSSSFEEIKLELFNEFGQLIWADVLESGSFKMKFSIPDLSPAIYYLKLADTGYKKIVIVK